MTIGAKLLGGVGSMLALTVVMSVTSMSSISGLNGELENATQKTARRLMLVGAMATAGSDMLAGMRGTVMFTYAKNQPKLEASCQQSEEGATNWQQAIDEIKPLLVREDGKRTVNELQKQLTALRSVVAEVNAAARRGDADAAMALAVSQGFPIYETNRRTTAHFWQIQQEILATQRARGTSIFGASRWTALGLSALAFLTGFFVLMVVRGTSRTLQNAAGELSEGAEHVASAAAQVSTSSQMLAQGSSEQAASLEETSASTEQINSMADRNNENSRDASALVAQSQKEYVRTNLALDEMVLAMEQINTQSGKIAKIIKVIDEIAFQTNILALNAAVEAARAGESGMGFAVVADEVRTLAQRSAQAAKDTAALIEESISKSKDGKDKVDQVVISIQGITGRAAKVRTLVDEVSSGSKEQARGIAQVAGAIIQMEKVTQSTAASAEETAAAAQELNAQSDTLRRVVHRLTSLVGENESHR